MFCVNHRDSLLLFFILVTVPSEHHPEMPDDKNTDKNWQKVSARKERAPAKNRRTSGNIQQMTIIHIIPEFPFPL